MKLYTAIFFFLLSFYLNAQNESIGFFSRIESNATILHEKGLERGEKNVKNFVSSFIETNGDANYTQRFEIEVNSALRYEVGELTTDSKVFSAMFLKKSKSARIEFLVIYEQLDGLEEPKTINQAREKWMRICNKHQASELVKQLYTTNAYYYNRGRLIQGTKAISNEYQYMNNPSYSLKLTPKYVKLITSDIAYEIGKCSGSYPLPYMIVWKKQSDDRWKVLMDSNY